MKDYGINLVNLNQEYETREKIYYRVCPICGKEFETNDHRRKYCSEECSKTAQKRQQKRWLKDNYEQHKNNQREYMKRRRRGLGQEYNKYRRKYYESNKEEFKAYARKYYREHRDEKREYARMYKKNHFGVIGKCRLKHNNCFECPTENGECLYE